MKQSITKLFTCLLISISFFTACSSNQKTEPEVQKMEELQDSLKKEEAQVTTDIENIRKSMEELDKEFEQK